MPPSKVLCTDPTVSTDHHLPDDRFIPLRPVDLIAALAGERELLGDQAAELPLVAAALQRVIEQEAAELDRLVCDAYAAFNPDRDTQPVGDLSAQRTPDGYASLHRSLSYLFEKANFEPLSGVQIDAAVRQANTHGLRVRLHPDRIESLEIWMRGRGEATRRRRRWWDWRNPLALESYTVPVYRRLAVVARLKNDPNVLLKLFKDIPVQDIEALLPHAEVTMSWWDRAVVLGGGAGTLGTTAAKLLSSAATILALTKFFWVILLGLGTMIVRTVLGYRRAQQNRDTQRTRHLYYQNLTNNAGVLHSLINMILHEELKEALLAYAMCRGGTPIRSSSALAARVQEYLARRFGASVRFDVEDAVQSLQRLGLWADEAAFRVVDPQTATRRLETHWRDGRGVQYHGACIARRVPPPAAERVAAAQAVGPAAR